MCTNDTIKVKQTKNESSQGTSSGISSVTVEDLRKIYEQPLLDLIFSAQSVHRLHHSPNEIQKSTLLSLKTGGCQEDCAYCAQSARYRTGVSATRLIPLAEVLVKAKEAKKAGATRFCMGASGRRVQNQDLPQLLKMIEGVKELGLESCATLGTLDAEQAKALKTAGLDYYNHNIDTSREYYHKIITTRPYTERLATLQTVREAGMSICTGGILGMGESREDRISFIAELMTFSPPPESLTINRLVPIAGTPLENVPPIESLEIIRTTATLRICAPLSAIRLSAGRETMDDVTQTLAFLAGANSIFSGDRLLTTPNQGADADAALFAKLGLHAQKSTLKEKAPHAGMTH